MRTLLKFSLLFLAILTVMSIGTSSYAQDSTYTLVEVVSQLERPVFLSEAPDASGRLFVVEQPGRIRIIQDNTLVEEPFLDLTDVTGISANERGLLGLAFHPDYAENGYFFVNYTTLTNGNTIVARYQVSADNPNLADPDSALTILEVEQPYANHNGGMVAFGPDGYLYVGMGDGGSGGDPQNNAQNLEEWLGKLLRLDVDSAEPYAIPADNPFIDESDVLPEIWAYGLRNPWRFSFDIATGDLYIADVGQNAYEEVNFQPADSAGGENYGWRVFEGNHEYAENENADNAVFPVTEYGREAGCSITGGYVYRGESLPDLDGSYIYGDYCTGTIWRLVRDDSGEWQNEVLLDTDANLTAFGQDSSGEIYVVDQRGGIYLLTAN